MQTTHIHMYICTYKNYLHLCRSSSNNTHDKQQQMDVVVVVAAAICISRFPLSLSFVFLLVLKNYSSLMARKRIMTHNTLRQFKRIHMITRVWGRERKERERAVLSFARDAALAHTHTDTHTHTHARVLTLHMASSFAPAVSIDFCLSVCPYVCMSVGGPVCRYLQKLVNHLEGDKCRAH